MSPKDPQYMTQALKNVLLMDAVTRCLQAQRSITAVSKLAYFDRIRHEGLTLVLLLRILIYGSIILSTHT